MSDGLLLNHMMRGYAPLASGREAKISTGLEGLPLMDQGGLSGIAAQVLLGPQIQGVMGHYGMTPFGVGHDQNIYDLMRRRQFMQSQQEAMQLAAESDREGYLRSFRGLAAMTGTPWGSQQRQAARSLADTAVQYSPLLAQVAPDLLDQMGGLRGSAAVMAQRMALGSRYRIDPVTGRMGQSSETVGRLSQQLFKDLYLDGDLAAMKGISAGQLGGMYDELSRRGMVGGPQASSQFQTLEAVRRMEASDRAGLEKAAATQGVTLPVNLGQLRPAELDKLRNDPTVSDGIKAFDAEKVKKSLKSYVDVVSAMRDIFGDMGRPNAPMGELIAGLEAMTQGGVGKIDSGRLNMMVRTTHELAKQSGMSLDSALQIQQHAANRAEMLGINSLHAVQATQGSMAWGSAFRAQGGASVPAWDRFNADQMNQLDTNLRVQAAASEQANRLGTFMRVHKSVGGFEAGSTAQAMAQAVTAGQTEFLDPATGEMRSTMMEGDQFTSILMKAKGRGGKDLRLSEGDIMTMMSERSSNEQYIHEFGIGDQVRKQQKQNTDAWLAHKFKNTLRDRLRSAGMDSEAAAAAAEKAAPNAVARIGELTDNEFADDQTRTARMADIIKDELSPTAAGEFLDKEGLGDDFHRLTAETVYSGVTTALVNDPRMLGYKNYQNLHATMRKATMERGDKNKMQAKFAAQVSEALSPLGHGTMLQRAIQYMQDAGPDANIPELLSQAMGGVKNEDIANSLQKPLTEVKDSQKKLEALHAEYYNAPDSESRQRALDAVNAQTATLKAAVSNLAKTAEEKHGISADQDALTTNDTSRAKNSLRQLITQSQDLHGLRGMFGHEASQAEQDLVTGKLLDPAERHIASDLLQKRRLAEARNVTEAEVAEAIKNKPSGMLAQDVRANLIATREDQARQITDEDVDHFIKNEKVLKSEAQSVVLHRRAAISLVPETDEIKAVLETANKGKREDDPTAMKWDQAETIAAARRRAARLGISDKDIATAKAALPANATDDIVIDKAFETKYAESQEVSNKERDEFLAHPDNKALKFDKAEGVKGVLAKRERDNKQRWSELWHSDSGAQFRESTELMFADVNDVATKAIMSEKQMRKMGPLAIEKYQELKGHEARLKTLALYHAGGDSARLLAGDLNAGMDPAERKQVRDEVFAIQNKFGQNLNWFETQLGREGRQWGDADAVARNLLNLPKTGAITSTALNPVQREKLDAARSQIEAAKTPELQEAVARKLLGLQPAEKLSRVQLEQLRDTKRDIELAQETGNSEATARNILKLTKDQVLTPDQTTRLQETKQLIESAKQPGDSDTVARKLLGFPEAEKLKSEQIKDLEKAKYLLSESQRTSNSDSAARKLLGLPEDQASNFENTKRAIGTAQKLDATTLAELKEHDRLTTKLDTDAKRFGVSRAELTALMENGTVPAGTTAAAFTPLTKDEEAKILAANDRYRSYEREQVAIKGQLSEAERSLRKAGLPDDEHVRQLRDQRDAKGQRMAEAANEVSDIAKTRGVTPLELLQQRKGQMSAADRKEYQENLKSYQKLHTGLEQRAKDMGVDAGIPGLQEGVGVLRQVDDRSRKFQDLENRGTAPMLQSLFQAYGLDTVKNKSRIDALATQLGDDTGRLFIRQLLGTESKLRDVANQGRQVRIEQAKTATGATKEQLQSEAAKLASSSDDPLKGVVAMANEYREINKIKDWDKRDIRLEKFKKDFNIQSHREFKQFQDAMAFQEFEGFLKIGDLKTGSADKRAEMLSRSLESMRQGGVLGQKEHITENAYREIQMTGTFHVTSDNRGEMNARGHAPVTNRGN